MWNGRLLLCTNIVIGRGDESQGGSTSGLIGLKLLLVSGRDSSYDFMIKVIRGGRTMAQKKVSRTIGEINRKIKSGKVVVVTACLLYTSPSPRD